MKARRGLTKFAAVASLLASSWGCAVSAQQRYSVDWDVLQPEILEHFSTLLKIDTSNPPGNETRAAQAVKAILEREGIECRLFASDPARANLVARIRGDGSKRPLLLMGHTDVVGAQRERWSVDPFGAVRKGDVIYGRGTVDDKDHVVADLMVMLLLKRHSVRLSRDVIFLAEAGEEGTPAYGIEYMIREHWPEIDAEYALAEGGSIVEERGKVHHVLIAATEKVPRGVRLVARGQAGHGSRPLVDNAVVHLAQAVARAGAWQTQMRLNATTRAYFERLAAISGPEAGARYRANLDPARPARAARADAYFRRYEPGHYSILRTSVVPTIIKGGFRSNVIPSEAEAYLDVRALPDEDMPKFLAELRKTIGDPSVEASFAQSGGRPASPPSRIDTDLFHALETVGRRMFDAPTLPGMLTGATDMAQLRARSVQAYGFGPVLAADDPLGGAHADDERISARSLRTMIEYLWNVTLEVAAR